MFTHINNELFKIIDFHRDMIVNGATDGWVTYRPGKATLILESAEMGENNGTNTVSSK